MTKKRPKNEAGRYYSLYKTESGFGGVVASDEGLVKVFLPAKGCSLEMESLIAGSYPLATAENPITRKAADLLRKYFSGEPTVFDLPVDLKSCTAFRQTVYEAVAQIPYGNVKSYAEVAAVVARPKAYRGIGSAMAKNPLPIIIPCHRVVGSTGEMTGYSAPGGVEMKKSLLRMEGVSLEKLGKGSKRTKNDGD
jgi:methylated-DNA-[protein]-cysteine S-methyltransferase